MDHPVDVILAETIFEKLKLFLIDGGGTRRRISFGKVFQNGKTGQDGITDDCSGSGSCLDTFKKV